MANVIEILLQTKDQMSGGLNKAAADLNVFSSRLAVMGAAAGVAGAAITSFVSKIADEVEQLDNLSASTGVSTQNLQVLQFAFRQGGVDAGALSQGLNFLNRAIANNDPALAKLGITSRNTFDALRQASAGLGSISDSAERAKLTFDVFGRGGAQLIPILSQLSSNFDGLRDSAIASGNAMSEQQLQTLRNVDAAMDKLSASVKGLGNQLAVGFAPAITSVLDPLTKLLSLMQRIDTEAKGVGKALGDWMAVALTPPSERRSLKGGLGGGGSFELPPGWGEVGPGGRGTVQFGPSFEDFQKFMASQPGPFRLPNQVGFSMTGGDALGLRGTNRPPAFEIGPMLDEAKTHLTTFSELMQKVAADIIQTFDIIGQHLHTSIVSVFMNLTNQAQTFRGAIVSVFNAVRDGVLQALGEIVAAQVTKAFIKILGIALSFITGNPVFGAAAGAAPPTDLPGLGGGMAMAPAPAGNTYVIQAISAKDMLSSLVAPTGAFRGANTRMQEVAAVS